MWRCLTATVIWKHYRASYAGTQFREPVRRETIAGDCWIKCVKPLNGSIAPAARKTGARTGSSSIFCSTTSAIPERWAAPRLRHSSCTWLQMNTSQLPHKIRLSASKLTLPLFFLRLVKSCRDHLCTVDQQSEHLGPSVVPYYVQHLLFLDNLV
jgi:hypothetical protein